MSFVSSLMVLFLWFSVTSHRFHLQMAKVATIFSVYLSCALIALYVYTLFFLYFILFYSVSLNMRVLIIGMVRTILGSLCIILSTFFLFTSSLLLLLCVRACVRSFFPSTFSFGRSSFLVKKNNNNYVSSIDFTTQ